MKEGWSFSRRSFLKWTGALTGAAAAGGLSAVGNSPFTAATASADTETIILPTACGNNCGGRCLIRASVKDGVIVKLEGDIAPDSPDTPALRACLRGRSYRQLIYHPDRLKYPMKRVGKRGEGKWERISWDEALKMMASEIKRIKEKYGPMSLNVVIGQGVHGVLRPDTFMRRLLAVYGGDTVSYFGNYSFGQASFSTPFTYGTNFTGNTRADLANSKLILMMGWNPCETITGTNSMYYLRKAKEAGARVICIDPRYTDSAAAVADEWIPIRPSTDSALMDAMAFVIITEKLYDQKFMDMLCIGFDEEHMPKDIPAGNSFKTYILGQADGTPKTPEWAEKITGIPADRIRSLAREYATVRPAALVQGFGPQRHANGDHTARSATVLTALTGNIGIKGGGGGGMGLPAYRDGAPTAPTGGVPTSGIPVPGTGVSIPYYMWSEAIVRGAEFTAEKELIRGAAKLPSNFKAIFNIAGNTLVNQHGDVNKTISILKDETKCEFIVACDIYMVPSAQYADLVLPGATPYERENIITPWGWGEYVLFQNKLIKSPYECRNEYDWITELAGLLGVKEKFTEGKSYEDWLEFCMGTTRKAYPDLPSVPELRKMGLWRPKSTNFVVAFENQVKDPEKFKFPTPSGKIEIFSKRLWDRKDPKLIPAIPKYVPAFDGPEDPLIKKYPLQLTGFHHKRRVHSMHDNNPWMTEADAHRCWMNPADAAARGISDGDRIKLFNDRGAVLVPVRITPRVMPGVLAMPQGAWFKPGSDGVDTGGCINVLTSQRGSYISLSNPQHSILVEAVKA